MHKPPTYAQTNSNEYINEKGKDSTPVGPRF